MVQAAESRERGRGKRVTRERRGWETRRTGHGEVRDSCNDVHSDVRLPLDSVHGTLHVPVILRPQASGKTGRGSEDGTENCQCDN